MMLYRVATTCFLLLSLKVSGLASSTNLQVPDTLSPYSTEYKLDDSVRLQMLEQKKQLAAQMASTEITHLVMHVAEQQYGYAIFLDGKMYIEQKSIPALPGTSGFKSVEDADKVAALVIHKIKQGEMPPIVSVEELNMLGIQ